MSLTHGLSPRIPHWPGDPRLEFEGWCAVESEGYFLRRFSMGEHAGTHLTAPISFYPDGRSVDAYSADEMVKQAVVIDARAYCKANRDYALSPAGLLEWERRHGPVPPDSLVLLLTGWAGRWNSAPDYLGIDGDGGMHFPGFGKEAADLLMGERRAAGLGTDTAGIEPGVDDTFSVSRLVLAASGLALQNLANLDVLPPTGTIVVVGVLPLEGGSGSPATVMAFLP